MEETARVKDGSIATNGTAIFKAKSQEELDLRTEKLIQNLRAEFNRINVISHTGVELETLVKDYSLWLTFSRDNRSVSIRIPLPVMSSEGIELMVNKDVVRVVCDYWLEEKEERLNYHTMVETLLNEDVNVLIPSLWSGAPLIHKVVQAFDKGQLAYMASRTQRLINEMINKMPLSETPMNDWAMSHRLVIIDPVFEGITSPDERLEYRVNLNSKYYERYGWTSIGLSDGTLADKNYLLEVDLRKLTPFGEYHNPQRNLYSTLSLKGDELPRIRSRSMQDLLEQGITRKGWNLVTAIVDTPLNFEDQILVSKRHLSLSHIVDRRYTVYGDNLRVKKGDKIRTGDVLGYGKDGQPVRFRLKCDVGVVTQIRKDVAELSGEQIGVHVVKVRGKRFLRDGSKFSNLHGNKGIVRFVDLGNAIDPRTGEEIPIDVMISAESINKRKNFGQILEALANNVNPGDNPIVMSDDLRVDMDSVRARLKEIELPEDGTWMTDTPWGELQAIVGRMFWGVTKDGEDQSWDEKRTELTNNRELRTSGLKFSHVEFKALTTRLGPKNPVNAEILSYAQGSEILQDSLQVLKSLKGEVNLQYPVVDATNLQFIRSEDGVFHNIGSIKGTIVDDECYPEGFLLRVPCYFQSTVNKKDKRLFTWGLPQEVDNKEECDVYETNLIFVPNALARRCWKHPSGKWGMNTVGMFLNAIVEQCHVYARSGHSLDASELVRRIARYFLEVTGNLVTKRGELSTYGMAVRYPHSVRGTAVLENDLPKDTVEIHTDMAKVLKVKSGDAVLVERFPCLGFMSIRPQYVRVTDDPQCKYVIRVHDNDLVSMGLDFDGDTIYIASFHTPAAIECLRNELKNPNRVCEDAIQQMNSKKVPKLREMGLDDYDVVEFGTPSIEEHAELVRKATGVKAHTGPVIALAYNLMRIVEGNVPYSHTEEHAYLELLLDFLGNTVFKQKHGIRSLQSEATDAICLADVDKMVQLGFDRHPSEMLCNLIRKEAASLGVRDLKRFHREAKEGRHSKIINFIVRRKHRIYFATRANPRPFELMDHLTAKPNDLPSYMLSLILRSKRESIEEKLDRIKAEKVKVRDELHTDEMRSVYEKLSAYIDAITSKAKS